MGYGLPGLAAWVAVAGGVACELKFENTLNSGIPTGFYQVNYRIREFA